MAPPVEILVVDDDVASLTGLLTVLRNLGYRCTGAADVVGGLALLDAYPYDLLITDIHLHGESGFDLIRKARTLQTDIAIVAISGSADEFIEKEVARLDVVLVRKPIDLRRLGEILAAAIPGGRRQRRWNRKRVAGGFGAKIGDASAKVVDISYGGFRLEMSSPPDPSQAIDMNLLPFGFVVNAQLVWINRNEPSGSWNCGAVLSELDPTIERAWRVVVDALPDSLS